MVVGRRGSVLDQSSDASSDFRLWPALLLGRLDDARRLAECSLKYSSAHLGHVAHALNLLGNIASYPHQCDGRAGDARYREALTGC
jgi:hypothetical protein